MLLPCIPHMQAQTAAAHICLDAPYHKQHSQLLQPVIGAGWLALLMQLQNVHVAAGKPAKGSSHASMLTTVYALNQHIAKAPPLVH